MNKRNSVRWTVLLSALGMTVGAIFYPVDEPAEPNMLKLPSSGAVVSKVSAKVEEERGRPAWIASDENPFAARMWEAPPPPLEAVRAVQPVELAPAEPAQEVPPPPLPYRFLGQMQDGPNRIFYLGHGEQVFLARQGEVLESSYKVVAVSDSAIEFESIQSGIKQTLPIPAQ
jgi:hypothetical protein